MAMSCGGRNKGALTGEGDRVAPALYSAGWAADNTRL